MKSNVLVIKQYCDIEVNVSKQVKGVRIELNVGLFPSSEDNIEMSQVDFNIVVKCYCWVCNHTFITYTRTLSTSKPIYNIKYKYTLLTKAGIPGILVYPAN